MSSGFISLRPFTRLVVYRPRQLGSARVCENTQSGSVVGYTYPPGAAPTMGRPVGIGTGTHHPRGTCGVLVICECLTAAGMACGLVGDGVCNPIR
jgi:hypothetical protein